VYDPMANSSFGPNASCGVFPGTQTTNISRTLGWHAFSISWDSRGTTLSIDDQQVFARAGTFNFDTIRLDLSGPFWRSDATYYFDDVSVRP
jgi:hypothetical protein